MSGFSQDIRYGLRMLRKNPAFTAIAVLTLALGIGANTAVFSVVNGVLLNPPPYAQPDRLMALYSHSPQFTKSSISYPNFLDWQRDNKSFSSLAAFREDGYILSAGHGDTPEFVNAEMVSATFFPTLGLKPVIGRGFRPEEDQLGGAPVALISGGLWKRKFGSSPDAVGKTITLDTTDYTVVGVIPSSFRYQSGNFHNSEVYVPIGQWRNQLFQDRRTGMGMDAVGRLAPGVTLAQAKADMDSIGRSLAAAYPEADKDTGVTVLPLKEDVSGDIRPFLLVLLAAVGFVLLIACANIANLTVVRSNARQREFAIRTALGAEPGRVVRLLLVESISLAIVGGALGLLLANWSTAAALKVLPDALPRTGEIHLDGRVLLFTLLASLFSGIVFGLVPALKASRSDVHDTLKEGGRGLVSARHRSQKVLVVAEMAIAVVLLISAGLMIRSLTRLWSVNPGFDPHNLLNFQVSLPILAAQPPAAIRATISQIDQTIESVPGVQAASLTFGSAPMQGDSEVPFWIAGQPKPATNAEMKVALFYAIQPGYREALHIPLLRGRFLTSADNENSSPAIVIDEQFARIAFPNQDPIGKHVNFEYVGDNLEIVGIVGHVKQWGLDENSSTPVLAQFYFPVSQTPDQFMALVARNIGAVVRTQGPPLAEMESIRQALRSQNRELVTFDVRPVADVISRSIAAQRFSMILLGVFAALATLLASIGIYGVISYMVGQRTHEIGVRMSLGAQPAEILRMVLNEGARLALLGVAIGVLTAFALTRLMATLLFGVTAHDPITFAGVAVGLAAVALLACYIPALRATQVDPLVALRYE